MKKNAFTLVELLAVLVIIGVLSAISIAVYSNSIAESKKSLSDFQKKQLVESARTYVAINTIGFNNVFDTMTFDEENSCVALSIKVLITEGLIGKEVLDPENTNKDLSTGYVAIRYNTNSSQYEYEYKEESLNDTVCKYKYWVEDNTVKDNTDID